MKLTLLSAMLMTAVVGITSANAADYKKNPFTLVYDGAITENVAGKVNIHPVKYDLHGIQIAANVYTPANYDPAKKYPAIVVAHPNGALKSRSPVCMRSALLSMAILLLPPMKLIRGLAVGCHVTWINLRIVLKISTVWLISSASILVLIAPVLVCWGFAGEEGIHLLPPRRTNDSNRLQPLACLIQDLYGAMVCRIHSWILFNNVLSRLQMHELRKSPVAKCFTPVMPT